MEKPFEYNLFRMKFPTKKSPAAQVYLPPLRVELGARKIGTFKIL